MLDASLFLELRDVARRRMGPIWTRVLERADDALFDLSQQGSGSEEAGYFEAMRELRRQRAEIEVQCRRRLDSDFASAQRTAAPAAAHAEVAGTEQGAGLSLVDADALEAQLACEHLAAAIERRHAEALKRFVTGLGRLLGIAELDTQASPLAPLRLAESLRDCIAPMVECMAARLVVLKCLERMLDAEYGNLLDELTRLMVARGVPVEAPPPRRAPEPVERQVEPAPAAPAVARPPAGRAGWSGDDAGDTGPGIPEELFHLMRSLFASYLGPRDDDQCTDDAIAGALASAAQGGRPGVPRLDTAVAVELLTAMQGEPQPLLMRALRDQQLALGGLLRQALIDRAIRDGRAVAGVQLQLRDEQGLTLVGMLFDVLLDQGHFLREVRERLIRLIVPYAKVALLDQRLFALKTHPARRLLNALTEACEANHGDTPVDREVLLRVTAVIERLTRDFDEDSSLFVELEERFREYMEQHRKRSALAERRTTDAQRGRERLEEARLDASLELASLVGEHPAPKPIADFLRRDWCHHLTVVALRSGSDSDAYREARAAGVALWLLYLGCEQGAPVPQSFGQSLLPVLQSSGQVGETAQLAMEQMRAALEAARPRPILPMPAESGPFEVVSATAGEELAVETRDADELQFTIDRHAVRPEDVERVRELKVGDWIEIVDASGVSQPAKLSWISPISSRLLFVNRRGMRLCVLSPEEMAGLVAEGKLTLRGVGAAFERALTQIVGKLKGEAQVLA